MTGGPTIYDITQELHGRVEEFARAYRRLQVRYPLQFPTAGLIQSQCNMLFVEFLKTGKVSEPPHG